ncbi:hypothetical protein ACQ4PT_059567 [Festuca glaucescens]
MAAANSSGLSSPVGGAGAGGDSGGERDGGSGDYGELAGFLAEDVDCCGSSNPAAPKFSSPEKAAAAAVAKVWKEHPAESTRWTSGFLGGIKLDDDIWDVRFNLDGQDNLERSLCQSDIAYLNLLALIEGEGYRMNDCMYYVKEKDRGIVRMELLDGMRKVEQMVELYEEKKCITLTVIKGVDDDGVVLSSQECVELTEDSAMLYLCTQQSNNMNKGKQILEAEEETPFAEDIQGCSEDMEEDGDCMEEDEVHSESDEECELNERLIDLKKRKRGASLQFCEDEAEDEDIFCDSDGSDDGSDCEFVSETENREAPPGSETAAAPPAAAAPTPTAAPAPTLPASRALTTKKKAPATPSATTTPAAPDAPTGRAPPAKKKASATPSSTTAPAAKAPPTKKKGTPASTTSAPTGAPTPFRAPRQAKAPATSSSTTGRLARERKESSRMKGYLTTSNIDKLTLKGIKKGIE